MRRAALAWRCGFVCLSGAAFTAIVATAAGLLTLGPLAAIAVPR